MAELCNVGKVLHEQCDLNVFTRQVGRVKIQDLTLEDQNMLALRTKSTYNSQTEICFHHEKKYISRYEATQKYCADPFSSHSKCISKDLRAVNAELTSFLNIIPGQKLCKRCKVKALENMNQANDDENEINVLDSSYSCKDFDRSSFNCSAEALGISPIKPVGKRDALSYAQNKAKRIKEKLNEKLADMMDISSEELNETNFNCVNCRDFERLIELMKAKLKISSTRDQIRILTLTPESWSIQKTIQVFGVTEYKIKCARQLKSEKGILSEPKTKLGKKLDRSVCDIVTNFYQQDEYSRCCPGMKDFVSVADNNIRTKHQKRLLLLNIKELFVEFKKEYPDVKIGFSKFCELRPKWVKTVNQSGMHSVCVCQYHQNVKLLVSVMPEKLDYKDILSKCVCSIDSRKCMLHLCPNCPGKMKLNEFLVEYFTKNEFEQEDDIFYKQWVSTDRTTLVSHYSTVEDFISKLINDVYELCPHHFISKAQANHLKLAKEKLPENELIVLLDFAENYSFVVQDAVQGFHWENSQATLHPFVVYFRSFDGELKHSSICVISDCLRHDQTAVHCFLTKVISLMKEKIDNIKLIHYYSDGAPSQYKNYKGLINLCYHKLDHGIDGEWNFFATSHGKSACDGIGGTVKRLATNASLMATEKKHILTPVDLFNWANKNISNIAFLYISTEEITEHCNNTNLNERYELAKSVKGLGTRSHHSYKPVSTNSLEIRRVSFDDIFSTVNFKNIPDIPSKHQFTPGKYIACIYDDECYIALIHEYSQENGDVRVQFMKRNGLFLYWFDNDSRNQCWIPIQHILSTVEVPIPHGRSARKYVLHQHDFDNIKKMLPNDISFE